MTCKCENPFHECDDAGDCRVTEKIKKFKSSELKPIEEITAPYKAEIASLKQKLHTANQGKKENLQECLTLQRQLADAQKDAEKWKDELFSVLVQDMTRPSAIKRIEEINAAISAQKESQ